MKKFESLKMLKDNLIKHTKEFASNIACDTKDWYMSTKKTEITKEPTPYAPSYEYVDEYGNNIIYYAPCNEADREIKDEDLFEETKLKSGKSKKLFDAKEDFLDMLYDFWNTDIVIIWRIPMLIGAVLAVPLIVAGAANSLITGDGGIDFAVGLLGGSIIGFTGTIVAAPISLAYCWFHEDELFYNPPRKRKSKEYNIEK